MSLKVIGSLLCHCNRWSMYRVLLLLSPYFPLEAILSQLDGLAGKRPPSLSLMLTSPPPARSPGAPRHVVPTPLSARLLCVHRVPSFSARPPQTWQECLPGMSFSSALPPSFLLRWHKEQSFAKPYLRARGMRISRL